MVVYGRVYLVRCPALQWLARDNYYFAVRLQNLAPVLMIDQRTAGRLTPASACNALEEKA